VITVITGAPGAGKSAALVSLLSELAKDRAIYCNGIPDLQIPHVELDDPTTWPDSVPDGSIIVIDEVQRVWRPRGPGSKVPPDISALETHRHRGLDFYLVTQAPRLIDSNVRALVGRHVHLRDVGILGRWWYEWPECCENAAAGWKQAPIKKRYRLPKAIFGQYKSASIHIKPLRSFPRTVLLAGVAVAAFGALSWYAYGSISSKVAPAQAPSGAGVLKAATSPNGVQSAHSQTGATGGNAVVPIDDRIAWIPRVSHRPESAPAYDHLRKVAVMPQVVGGYCLPQRCKCITQQGTDPGMSDRECRAWIENRPFDPYGQHAPAARADSDAQARNDQPQQQAQPVNAGV